ncbi:MAG: two-component system sensor protein [Spartobacteria bacterium]|nr:two-component system sensor protein [Spartobacteria bacterium]
MPKINNPVIVDDASAERADELFKQHQDQIYRNTDKLFARLMLCQWLVGIAMAFLITPYTWSGQSSQIHEHVWAAIFVGGIITIFPLWMTYAWPGRAATRYVIAVAQMLMSALLISLTGGRIETHFHVFGSLVILSFYREWRVLVPATIVVALDHFLRGIYWPYSVYGVLTATPWRSLEHAGWVLFEDTFLVISCARSIREMRSIANRTAALETSEQNFRQIFEEAPIGMAVVGLDQRFQQANTSLCQMVDYSQEELAGRTPLDITYPEDVEKSEQLAKIMLDGTSRNTVEKRYLRKNGEVVWATRTGCVIRDKAGNPRHFLIMVEDISERKRAEKALGENKHRLEIALRTNQLIMDNSQDVICTIDEAGRFLTINAACQNLWGYNPSELIGHSYIDLVCPEDRSRTLEIDAVIRKLGKLADFVNRYIRKDGTAVDVLWSASWSEAEKTYFCVAHDVTKRQQTEQALREAKEAADHANNAKSEFLSRMSHELRTPLNAILGFSQLLERQNPTETQRERITYIISAGRHLLDLINEVLDISRIEAGGMQLSVEPVCLGDALAEAIDLMRPLAAERSIELITPAECDKSSFVLADRQRLKQVLLNLLTNAVKYTPRGGRATISADVSGTDKHRVVVSDTGPGLSKEKLSRLFTAFDRLGAEQSDVQGTGLGLALSQRLIHAMGGTIGAESDVGHGSTFWIELPSTNSPLQGISARPTASVAKTRNDPSINKRTVLYIEDNLSNLNLIEQILEEQPDIELMTAMQGNIGLDLARRHAPDLILLDLHLPDMPGWDVLARLKASEETRLIPTIVISADATARQVDRLMAAGARAYLTKPLDVEKFLRVLQQSAMELSDAAENVPTDL